MTQALLRLLGLDPELLAQLEHARLVILHPWLLTIGLILLVPAAWFIFQRQQQNLGSAPRWLKIALSVTRVTVLALLLVALAAPALKLDHTHERRPTVVLLVDESASMTLPAGPFDDAQELTAVARAAGYAELDAESRKALQRIERGALLAAALARGQAALTNQFELRREVFGGRGTEIGDALARTLDDASLGALAGIVLFSDGQNTGGLPPADAAALAAARGVPVFTVPVGSTSVPRDVAVVDVSTAGQVSLGDQARVTAVIESRGLDGQLAQVELRDGDQRLDHKELRLRGAEQQTVDLVFEAKQAGPQFLTVHITEFPDEAEHARANNQAVAVVRVSPERLRVLYVEGAPRWDFRFLKNALRRDNGIGGRTGPAPEILVESEWRRRPADQLAAAWPADVDALAEYHTIILGDVSPRLLDAARVAALATAVRERGVGLIIAAGSRFMPQAHSAELQELLPVRLLPRAGGVDAPAHRPFRVELTPEGTLHDVLRLEEDPSRNRQVWGQLPAFHWSAAVEAPAPGATVLAWNTSVASRHGVMPLIAWQFAGQGRVLFVGTDETWRWRQNFADRYFYRFWGQATRFVARADETQRRTTLTVGATQPQPGEPVEIELQAFTADGAPRSERQQSVTVLALGQPVRTIALSADRAASGRYVGRFTPATEGRFKLVFDPGDGTAPVSVTTPVLAATDEWQRPHVNRAALATWAQLSGGELVELGDWPGIGAQLRGEPQELRVRREASLWDNWLMAVLLIGVYCVDVGLRRLRGLA